MGECKYAHTATKLREREEVVLVGDPDVLRKCTTIIL